MSKKPLQIGITGGIGTGKSTVSRIFAVLGIQVYDADTHSKWLLDNHLGLRKELIEAFGADAYKNEKYNREYLAKTVFFDKEKVAQMNRIVHPRIFEDYENWVEKNKNSPYLIKEAALLYESGSYKNSDKIIVVYSPMKLRIERIKKRDSFRTDKEIQNIMNNQLDENEKLKRADFVIYNDDEQFVIPQVLKLHEYFLAFS